MSAVFDDLHRKGLAGAAVLFTAVALSAFVTGLIVSGELIEHMSRRMAFSLVVVFWLTCMTLNWRYLARSRQTWPPKLTSTSLFHSFQAVTAAICLGYAFFFAGTLQSPSLLWVGFAIEFLVVLFYCSYVFLGFTLRYPIPRSSIPGFFLALGSIWWSSRHLPGF